MRASGGELVADVLVRQGVRFLFTLCGGHVSPILVAAKARGLRIVDTRHEATAVFAADAAARLTGRPGLAVVTAGPGVTNTLTALENARLAQSPLVLIGGATATLLRGRGALQDIDQMALVRPHVKWARRVSRLREVGPVLAEAFRVSAAGVPGPVFVECPVDLLYPEPLVRDWYGAKTATAARGLARRAERWYLERHLRRLFGGVGADAAEAVPVVAPAPDEAAVDRAARLLRRAERPVLLVGSQALLAPAGVAELAAAIRALGVPVYLAGMARGLLGAAEALQLRHRRKEALREADLVVLAGVPCDFRLDYGRQIARGAVLVSANRSREDLLRNRRPTLAVPGAPDLFLLRLAGEAARRPEWRTWLATLRAREAVRDAEIEAQARTRPEHGRNPIALCQAIDHALGAESIVVADGGDFVATASYVLRPRGPLSWLDPGPFGTLGVGAGFALGAKLARPEAEVFLLYGDGAFGYSLAEADTFARHGLGLVAVIGNDQGWTQIAREQVEVLGDDVATVLAPTDYESAAAGLGAGGLRLDATDDADRVIAEARAIARSGRPAYINAAIGRTDFRKGSISI